MVLFLYAPIRHNACPTVLHPALPLEARVAALETAVTHLQKQLAALQGALNQFELAQNNGFGLPGVATFQTLAQPSASEVLIPFYAPS